MLKRRARRHNQAVSRAPSRNDRFPLPACTITVAPATPPGAVQATLFSTSMLLFSSATRSLVSPRILVPVGEEPSSLVQARTTPTSVGLPPSVADRQLTHPLQLSPHPLSPVRGDPPRGGFGIHRGRPSAFTSAKAVWFAASVRPPPGEGLCLLSFLDPHHWWISSAPPWGCPDRRQNPSLLPRAPPLATTTSFYVVLHPLG